MLRTMAERLLVPGNFVFAAAVVGMFGDYHTLTGRGKAQIPEIQKVRQSLPRYSLHFRLDVNNIINNTI